MTLINLDDLSPRELIAQYVIECRNKGHILPYDDYQVIDAWLSQGVTADQLLLILADILPEVYEAKASRSFPPSLKRVQSRVTKRIREIKLMAGPAE